MTKRKSLDVGLAQLARNNKPLPEYVPAIVAARVLYLSRTHVLRYFASGDLQGFRVGLGKTSAIQIARSSIIEFAAKHQGRTVTLAEIARCTVE
jgi:hypothetical protein